MTWQDKGKVALVGVGFSSIERNTDVPLGVFATTAIQNAVADAGLRPQVIDGLATYPEPPFLGALHREGQDMVSVEYVLNYCQVGPARWYADLNGGMVTAGVAEASMALLSGVCNYALVWRAMHHPRGSYGRVKKEGASGEGQFVEPYGCMSPVQWHALAYRRYIEAYGATPEQMATLAVNSRRNANLNEHAFFRETPLTRADYLKSRMISDPLRLYDCDVPVQACAAVVLTTAERARALPNPPAYLAGFAFNAVRRQEFINYTLEDYMEPGQVVAKELWNAAGLGPRDMAAAQLYDGFAPSTLYWLESAGFCGRGEAYEFIQDDRIALEGELPVNTFGGSLSQGRMHGMGHLAEAVLQVTGRAGRRQVKDAGAVCVFSGSPMFRGSGLVLTREP